jgi:hypothetical protein
VIEAGKTERTGGEKRYGVASELGKTVPELFATF